MSKNAHEILAGRKLNSRSTDEMIQLGSEGVAREVLAEDEKKFKAEVEYNEKLEAQEVYITYAEDEALIPEGDIPFVGILTTANREGERPVTTKLKIHHASVYFEQILLKAGPNASDLVKESIGKRILINVDQYMKAHMRPPVIVLPVNGQNREFLILSDRDIKYIF